MMGWKVAGALVCALSLFGCNNDVEKPEQPRHVTVDTPTGKLMILNPSQAGDVVSASVVGDQLNATFRLISTGDHGDNVGGRAELLDPSGQLLFSFESRMNTATGQVTIIQATPDDYLSFSVVGDDERVHEEYDANGDVATFNYPALSDDTQRRAVNYYKHGLLGSRLPTDVSEYVQQVDAFESYYAAHASNTLDHNPNGELLAQILTSPELPLLLVGEGSEPHVIRWIAQTCSTARHCMAIICRTNPGSLACDACSALSLACSIMELICTWLHC